MRKGVRSLRHPQSNIECRMPGAVLGRNPDEFYGIYEPFLPL